MVTTYLPGCSAAALKPNGRAQGEQITRTHFLSSTDVGRCSGDLTLLRLSLVKTRPVSWTISARRSTLWLPGRLDHDHPLSPNFGSLTASLHSDSSGAVLLSGVLRVMQRSNLLGSLVTKEQYVQQMNYKV